MSHRYAEPMRNQLRMVVAGVVSVVIIVAWIVEPPGTLEGVGYAVVLVDDALADSPRTQ